MITNYVDEAGDGEALLIEKIESAVPSCRIIVTELRLFSNDLFDVHSGEFGVVPCLNNAKRRY